MKRNILALCMMFLMLFAGSITTHAYTEGYFEYEVSEQSVTITGYFGNDTEVTVPAAIAGNPVNTIAKGAFVNTTVKTLNLPDTIMTIEAGAIGIDVAVVYNSNVKELDTSTDKTVESNTQADLVEDSIENSTDNTTDQGTIEEVEVELDSAEDKKENASEQKEQSYVWLIGIVVVVIGSCIGILFYRKQKQNR